MSWRSSLHIGARLSAAAGDPSGGVNPHMNLNHGQDTRALTHSLTHSPTHSLTHAHKPTPPAAARGRLSRSEAHEVLEAVLGPNDREAVLRVNPPNLNHGQNTRANRTRHTTSSSTQSHAKQQHTNATQTHLTFTRTRFSYVLRTAR